MNVYLLLTDNGYEIRGVYAKREDAEVEAYARNKKLADYWLERGELWPEHYESFIKGTDGWEENSMRYLVEAHLVISSKAPSAPLP